MILHTGDLTHFGKVSEFDALDQILKGLRRKEVFYVPGEHDVASDEGRLYLLNASAGPPAAKMWQSFDHKGVHFIGLNNSTSLDGLGQIGAEQLEWFGKDVARLAASTPIVVFAHVPLWSVCSRMGAGLQSDSAQAP